MLNLTSVGRFSLFAHRSIELVCSSPSPTALQQLGKGKVTSLILRLTGSCFTCGKKNSSLKLSLSLAEKQARQAIKKGQRYYQPLIQLDPDYLWIQHSLTVRAVLRKIGISKKVSGDGAGSESWGSLVEDLATAWRVLAVARAIAPSSYVTPGGLHHTADEKGRQICNHPFSWTEI